MNPLHSLRGYTAQLFAKAVKELFPQSKLIAGEVSEIGFSYTWECPQLVNQDMLPLLEEKMRSWVKNTPAARFQEMIPSNAAAFFRARKESFLEETCLESEEDLVSVICLDDYADIAYTDTIPSGSFFFKLFDLKKEGKIVTVTGTAFKTNDELKEFVKRYKEASKKDWKETAVLSKLVVIPKGEAPLFLPKGVHVRNKFTRFETAQFPEGSQEVRTPQSWTYSLAESHALLYEADPRGPIWETKGDKTTLHLFSREDEVDSDLKSSLLLFDRTAKILRFETQWILGGIYPPKFENRKGVKEAWKEAVNRLKRVLSEEQISCSTEECLSQEGPFVQLICLDSLGRSIEGPRIEINCMTLEKLGLSGRPCFQRKILLKRELFPSLDSLVFKLIEAGSLKQVEVELEK